MIGSILNICKKVDDGRTIVKPTLKVQEEVGELSTEVNISLGNLPKSKGGEDGVIGEACDAIIAIVDVIYKDNEDVTLEEINNTIQKKLEKWYNLKK